MNNVFECILTGPVSGEKDILQCMIWITAYCSGILMAIISVQRQVGGILNCCLIRMTRFRLWMKVYVRLIVTALIHTAVVTIIYTYAGGSEIRIWIYTLLYLLNVVMMNTVFTAIQICFNKNISYIIFISGCIITTWIWSCNMRYIWYSPWSYGMAGKVNYIGSVFEIIAIGTVTALHGRIIEYRLEHPDKNI